MNPNTERFIKPFKAEIDAGNYGNVRRAFDRVIETIYMNVVCVQLGLSNIFHKGETGYFYSTFNREGIERVREKDAVVASLMQELRQLENNYRVKRKYLPEDFREAKEMGLAPQSIEIWKQEMDRYFGALLYRNLEELILYAEQTYGKITL